ESNGIGGCRWMAPICWDISRSCRPSPPSARDEFVRLSKALKGWRFGSNLRQQAACGSSGKGLSGITPIVKVSVMLFDWPGTARTVLYGARGVQDGLRAPDDQGGTL